MIFSTISLAITSCAVYLYPSYCTFKALTHRTLDSEQEKDNWLIYWCVVGAFAAFETSLEWLVNWMWLYTEIKTLFLVFLSQGGATILYRGYLAPNYAHYEPKIDAHLAALRTRTTAYVQEQFQTLYKLVLGSVGAAQNNPPAHPAAGTANGAAGVAQNLWNTYGQNVLAAGAKFIPTSTASTDRPAPQNRSVSSSSFTPSMHSTTGSSTIDPQGPRFPMPDVSSSAGHPSAFEASRIPLPPSSMNLAADAQDDWRKTQ